MCPDAALRGPYFEIRWQALGRPALEVAASAFPLIGEWGRTNRSPSLSIGRRRLRVVVSEPVVLLQLLTRIPKLQNFPKYKI